MRKGFFVLLVLVCSAVFAQPAGKVLVDQEVTVVRSDFKDFHFRVPDDIEGTWEMRGSYQTSGGFSDDITFMAFDQQNYVRWFSHYKHQAVVKDERKKQGTFSFVVAPGETYYFVLYNFFSTISNINI